MTKKQVRFVEEYLVDLNATQAAIRAGYSSATAASIGSENLKKPEIRACVDARLAILAKRTGVNEGRVLRELAKMAFVNPADIVDFDTGMIREDATMDDTATIASIKVKRMPSPHGDGIEREIKVGDKLKALELLGKHLGLFKENISLTGALPVVIREDLELE